jgi:nucleoside-diphosphate-sugar epimerase
VSPILVTGAQGFLGRFLVAEALTREQRVVGIGRSLRRDDVFTHRISSRGNSFLAPLPLPMRAAFESPLYAYHAVDVLDTEKLVKLLQLVRPSAVVHLASALRGDIFDHLFETNVRGVMSLLDAIDRAGIHIGRVILGSSAAVYGEPESLPLVETARCQPAELYGLSKFAGERVAAIKAASLNVHVCYARMFNLVGAGQDERHACGRFAQQAVDALEHPELTIHVGDLRPTRDFIDVRDAAAALLVLLRAGNDGEAYNVCCGVETAIDQVLSMTLRVAGISRARVEQSYRRDADAPRHVGNNLKLRRLGWSPRFALESSIGDLVQYYQAVASERAVSTIS